MRLTWEEIQKAYPNQWVLMGEMVYENIAAPDPISAVVIYSCSDRWDINRFMGEHPDKIPNDMAVSYTGAAIEYDFVGYNENVEMELCDEWA